MTTRVTDELILLPVLTASPGPNGGLVLTRKYLNGAAEYARTWPGPVTTLIELSSRRTTDMDHVEVHPGQIQPGLEVRPTSEGALRERLATAAVALAFLSPFEAYLAALCRDIGMPLVYGSEYTLKTEKQIVDAEVRNPLRRFRRKLWLNWAERQRLRALPDAAGIQCSGTPTYDAYQSVNPKALLFFDNRVPESDIIAIEILEARLATLQQRRPLRLVFGGRLIAMKGVQYLPAVANELRRAGVSFTLEIFGSGTLESRLRATVQRCGLDDVVKFGGVLDFDDWVAYLKINADLFVCCHPQGDPSSTYPEVMSCGVPIAGFANDAFAGIVRQSGSGWLSPLGKPRPLAQLVARLDSHREEIAASSLSARNFAAMHAFEPTFARRVAHLVSLSRLPQPVKDDYFARYPDQIGFAAAPSS